MISVPAFGPVMFRLMPKVWKRQKDAANTNTLPYDIAILNNFTAPTDRLAKITAPTLVMVGGKPAMAKAQSATATATPRAPDHTLAGQTHQVSTTAVAAEPRSFFAN